MAASIDGSVTSWTNQDSRKRQLLNEPFRLNRRVMKAYLLKGRLWTYTYEGAALRYSCAGSGWRRSKRWLKTLLRHLEGILNYYRMKIPFGVVEAVNGNTKTLLRRGRGYRDLRYLLLKVQRMAALRTEFLCSESRVE